MDNKIVAVALIALAGIILVFSKGNDIALFSSIVLFLTGILFLALSTGNMYPKVATLLASQHQLNVCSFLARFGCVKPAEFVYDEEYDGKVIQFNEMDPGSAYMPCASEAVTRGSVQGLLITPSCVPLITDLEKTSRLYVPPDIQSASRLYKEVVDDTLELVEDIATEVNWYDLSVEMKGFAFYEGCKIMQSHDQCRQNPCAVCSLFACLAARMTGNYTWIRSITLDDKTRSVKVDIAFTLVSGDKMPISVPKDVSYLVEPYTGDET